MFNLISSSRNREKLNNSRFPRMYKKEDVSMNKYNGIVHTCEMYCNFFYNEIKNIEKYYSYYIISQSRRRIILEINNIKFAFINFCGYTTLKIDFIKLLDKPNISSGDLNEIYSKIYEVLDEISLYQDKPLTLKRFDYRLDVFIEDKNNIDIILKLYKKSLSNFYRLCKSTTYDNLYYKSTSKTKSMSLNIYAKEKERFAKGREPTLYEKNIIRYEIQLRNKHLNYKKTLGYNKDLDTYLDEHLFLYYLEKYIIQICYLGDFYNINEARKIINKNISKESERVKLVNFLISISRSSMDTVKNNYSHSTYKKMISKLEELNIHPILIPKNLNIKFIKNPLSRF